MNGNLFEPYVKITYQSDPIGPENIILYLTTFDLDAFERDQELKELPTKQITMNFGSFSDAALRSGITTNEFMDRFSLNYIETHLENYINDFYTDEINKLKRYIESNRDSKLSRSKTKIKNLTNCDDIYCDVIEGNVVNCDNVHCKEIRGNIVNSEIYKED